MLVGNPVFPVSVGLEKAAGIIEKAIRAKNWKEFEKGKIKLVLKPFYLFYYDAVFKEKGKKPERGRLALDGETAELGREIAGAMPEESGLVRELPDEYPLIVRKPLFSEKEAGKIALLKTSSLIGAERDSIVLTGFSLVYYPMWLVFVAVKQETIEIEISAVTGDVLGEEKVPLREKGFVEITMETLEELKQPGAWLRYSKEIAGFAGGKAAGAPKQKLGIPALFRNPLFWLSAGLAVVLIAVVLYL